LEENRYRKIQAIFAEKGDNKKPELVRAFVEQYLQISRGELAQSWNGGLPLLNRLLYSI